MLAYYLQADDQNQKIWQGCQTAETNFQNKFPKVL